MNNSKLSKKLLSPRKNLLTSSETSPQYNHKSIYMSTPVSPCISSKKQGSTIFSRKKKTKKSKKEKFQSQDWTSNVSAFSNVENNQKSFVIAMPNIDNISARSAAPKDNNNNTKKKKKKFLFRSNSDQTNHRSKHKNILKEFKLSNLLKSPFGKKKKSLSCSNSQSLTSLPKKQSPRNQTKCVPPPKTCEQKSIISPNELSKSKIGQMSFINSTQNAILMDSSDLSSDSNVDTWNEYTLLDVEQSKDENFSETMETMHYVDDQSHTNMYLSPTKSLSQFPNLNKGGFPSEYNRKRAYTSETTAYGSVFRDCKKQWKSQYFNHSKNVLVKVCDDNEHDTKDMCQSLKSKCTIYGSNNNNDHNYVHSSENNSPRGEKSNTRRVVKMKVRNWNDSFTLDNNGNISHSESFRSKKSKNHLLLNSFDDDDINSIVVDTLGSQKRNIYV